MGAKRVVRLGQEVFVLSHGGEVIRTVVGKIEGENYQFLNGGSNHQQHWFFFGDAVTAASARIDARQKALRKELRALAHKRRTLETQNYRDSVSAPYRAVDLRDETSFIFARRRRTRELKKIRVPEAYLMPGCMVYAVITPATRSSWGGIYRPHNHFVLETEVRSVCFSPDGQAHYAFSTPFIVEESFPSREEATAKLRSFSEPGTEEPIPFVSSKQEEEENKKLLDDDIPF